MGEVGYLITGVKDVRQSKVGDTVTTARHGAKEALTGYRDNTMDYKPLRMNAGDTEVIVRTEVRRPGQAPVQIDYNMTKTPEGWKAYDVVVAGVSLVTNYRDEFNDIVRNSGIDGLVKALDTKNKGPAPPPPAAK